VFLDGDNSDVAFNVKGQIFPAHKVILKCHASDLFELCEANDIENPMPIDDVELEVFQVMLGFVYGASIDNKRFKWKAQTTYLLDPSKHRQSILRAAGKYGMTSLRETA
jgi:hypothetical protein